ncbi:MAG TPA: ABC transporter ATP-binding protein [Lachnospiraceae bacterium]|nr:ABC transporter ATP-binding protein [Lachnospiraceae bacterium]HPF28529.1 ABC transporter ATP-binding protein [Lachnospiraceae bacterium]
MGKIIKKMNLLLDGKQKRFMIVLVLMMLIGAILETASISIILPVVGIVMDPEAVTNNSIVAAVYNFLGMHSVRSFTILIMLSMVGAFVLKNAFLFVQQKVLYNFVYTNQFRTSERMMKNYMRRDYEFYLNADTAVIQRSITSDVNNMYGLILSLLQIISEVIVFICLVAVLLIADFWMTVMISILLIVTLWIIKKILKPVMRKAGEDNQNFYSGLFKWISQTVTGIKEVKIGGRESYFVDEYIKCGKGYVDAVQKYTLYNNVPRLLIETVSVAGMILYLLYLILAGEDTGEMLAIVSAFGVAVVRLMPCANRINNQINNIAFFEPFFMGVSDNLQDEINGDKVDLTDLLPEKEKLPVHREITLTDISYKYPNTEKMIFDKATLKIPVGSSVGIVGTSGAGKSTIVDVLLGMLRIEEGSICADGVDVLEPKNYRKWLKNVGYIPQTIFMLDDTIRKNVAFGIPEDEISEERLWEVLKEAQLDEFIKGLPKGLETGIGERGIRLSGGQRQRIGIARALYENPEVLILDEATSALDNDTEAAIMDSINLLHGQKTLIIIAHRLQTIEKCDEVYRVEEGKIRRER